MPCLRRLRGRTRTLGLLLNSLISQTPYPLLPNTCWSDCLWITSRCMSLVCAVLFSLLAWIPRLWTGCWLWFCSMFNKYLIGFVTQTLQVSRFWEMGSLHSFWKGILKIKMAEGERSRRAGDEERVDSYAYRHLGCHCSWARFSRKAVVGSFPSSVVEGNSNEWFL